MQYTGPGGIHSGAAYFGGGTLFCCTAIQQCPSNESGAVGVSGCLNWWDIFMLPSLGSVACLNHPL